MVRLTKKKTIIIISSAAVLLTAIILVYVLWLRPQSDSASKDEAGQSQADGEAVQVKSLTKEEHRQMGAKLQSEARELVKAKDLDGATSKLKQSQKSYQAAGDEASAETIRIQIKDITARNKSSKSTGGPGESSTSKSSGSDTQPDSDSGGTTDDGQPGTTSAPRRNDALQVTN